MDMIFVSGELCARLPMLVRNGMTTETGTTRVEEGGNGAPTASLSMVFHPPESAMMFLYTG